MEKQKKSVGTVALVVLLLIVTIISLVLATYAWAKYTTTYTSNETNAVVAKWNVTGNSANLTWEREFTFVTPSRLAPGTSGTIPVTLDVTGTEVDVGYKVTIERADRKPTNLNFYTQKGGDVVSPNGGVAYTGTIPVNGANLSKAIYWEWPYETGDDNEAKAANDITDTNEGIDPQTMSVVIKVEAWQIKPGNQA